MVSKRLGISEDGFTLLLLERAPSFGERVGRSSKSGLLFFMSFGSELISLPFIIGGHTLLTHYYRMTSLSSIRSTQGRAPYC